MFTYTLGANLENLTLTGTNAIDGTGNALDNVNALDNTIIANDAGNVLSGGAGNDTLPGGAGADFLYGGEGDDTLTDTKGNGVYSGGAGNDAITVSGGNTLIAGGAGNDTIRIGTGTGAGKNVIAFNRGDGADTIISSVGSSSTLSFGTGISYADLTLKKSGNDLILDAGRGDCITLKDWYSNAANRNMPTLQFFKEGESDYSATSTDVTRNKKVETFDFAKLVTAYDQARAALPASQQLVTPWAVTNGLLKAHLGGSDTQGLGGDLAWQYGQTGNLAGGWLSAAQTTVGDAQFASSAQSIQRPLTPAASNDLRLG